MEARGYGIAAACLSEGADTVIADKLLVGRESATCQLIFAQSGGDIPHIQAAGNGRGPVGLVKEAAI